MHQAVPTLSVLSKEIKSVKTALGTEKAFVKNRVAIGCDP